MQQCKSAITTSLGQENAALPNFLIDRPWRNAAVSVAKSLHETLKHCLRTCIFLVRHSAEDSSAK
jgi:hypothetical protein